MGAQAIASARVSELWSLSAGELLRGYAARSFTPVEAVDALAARIESLDGALGAFTTLCLDRARSEAAAGRSGPLAGVPFAAKDLFDSEGVRTTYGSRMFLSHVPARDAAAVELMRASGALLVGKTQTHEFAWGITSINEGVGSSFNPWDTSRVPGGSSGGSAVALAARMVPLALASDTGGSVRIPAGFCGVMGFKPTYGRVSTEGVWPLAPTMDHAGYMARTPEDLELLFGITRARSRARHDRRGLPRPARWSSRRATAGACSTRPSACSRDWGRAWSSGRSRRRRSSMRSSRRSSRSRRRASTRKPACSRSAPTSTATTSAGGWSAPLRSIQPCTSALRATARRCGSAFGALLADDALLLSPVSAVPPARTDDAEALGEFRSSVMPNTTPHNLAGLPVCAVRAGFDDLGLPVGVQIAAAPWRDDAVLGAARAFYEATPDVQVRWPDQRTPHDN